MRRSFDMRMKKMTPFPFKRSHGSLDGRLKYRAHTRKSPSSHFLDVGFSALGFAFFWVLL